MKRTSIMAEPATLESLRRLAAERGVSFAEVVREALEQKASEFRPAPRSVGVGDSGDPDTAGRAGEERIPPRSWR